MSEKTQKSTLSQGVVWVFGLSEIAALLVASIGTQWFPFYLTNIILLPAAAMGTVLLVTRIFDIVTILLSSVVEEKVVLKWGKCRSWIGLMCPIAAVIGVIQYCGIGSSLTVQVLIACICYVLFFGFFNFGRTAQMALLNTIGKTPEERGQLSARTAQFASMAQVVFSLTFLPLVLAVSGAKDKTGATQKGFMIAVGVFMVIYVVCQLALFFASKPYDKPGEGLDEVSKANKLTGKEMAQQIFKNPPLMLMLVAETCKTLTQNLFNGYVAYYFTIVAQDISLQPRFATIIAIFTLCGSVFIGQFLRRKLGKKNSYMFGFFMMIVALLASRLLAEHNSMIFLIIMGIGFFFFAGIASCGPAMFGDCVEYGKYRTGKEARAFIMGLYTLPIKVGVWILGGVSGYLLAMIGYDATVAVTPEVQSGMFNIITFGPMAFAAIGLVCTIFYPLTEKKVAEIMESNRRLDAGESEKVSVAEDEEVVEAVEVNTEDNQK